MAWYSIAGRYGSAVPQRQQAAFPVSIADLWSPAQEPDYPEAPTLLSDASQLPPDQQKRMKRDQLLKVLAAALGARPGYMGTDALSAVANGGGAEQEAVDRANALAQQKFGFERQRAQIQADTMKSRAASAQGKHTAEAVVGKAQHLWELSADDPNLQGRIATAAQRGPDAMEELSKIEASLPGRQALRKAGVDPDDPMAVEQAKADAKFKMEQAQKAADLKAQNASRLELERQMQAGKYGTYKPEYHAPHEGSNITAADGSIYHVVDGRVTGKVDIPGGARQSQQGLDPLREALRVAEAEYKASLIAKEEIKPRAKELYDLMTGGVEGLDGLTEPPEGGHRVASPLGKAPPPPKPKAGGNARLIPAAGAATGGDPFAAVKDQKAKAFAQRQLDQGVPLSKIMAYLKQHGAL